MFVGEQPGDQEDRAGHPFVGPAGKLLDRALEDAGLERDDVYVTNVVKHFKWDRGAKSSRRIHKKPSDLEIRACRPWLDQELALVQPEIVVCLGATAAQALLGRSFRVTKERGKKVRAPFGIAVATVHPSSVLRAIDDASRRRETKAFFADIRKVATYLEQPRERALDAERPLPRAVEPEAERADGSRTSKRTRRTSERETR
jgi:DNA polymerase